LTHPATHARNFDVPLPQAAEAHKPIDKMLFQLGRSFSFEMQLPRPRHPARAALLEHRVDDGELVAASNQAPASVPPKAHRAVLQSRTIIAAG
jgi:hypothetical protein